MLLWEDLTLNLTLIYPDYYDKIMFELHIIFQIGGRKILTIKNYK